MSMKKKKLQKNPWLCKPLKACTSIPLENNVSSCFEIDLAWAKPWLVHLFQKTFTCFWKVTMHCKGSWCQQRPQLDCLWRSLLCCWMLCSQRMVACCLSGLGWAKKQLALLLIFNEFDLDTGGMNLQFIECFHKPLNPPRGRKKNIFVVVMTPNTETTNSFLQFVWRLLSATSMWLQHKWPCQQIIELCNKYLKAQMHSYTPNLEGFWVAQMPPHKGIAVSFFESKCASCEIFDFVKGDMMPWELTKARIASQCISVHQKASKLSEKDSQALCDNTGQEPTLESLIPRNPWHP